jgi:hypothetical protein
LSAPEPRDGAQAALFNVVSVRAIFVALGAVCADKLEQHARDGQPGIPDMWASLAKEIEVFVGLRLRGLR